MRLVPRPIHHPRRAEPKPPFDIIAALILHHGLHIKERTPELFEQAMATLEEAVREQKI